MNNDYSSKDFTSIYEDLLAIVEASTTLWNPRYSTEADPGVVILKAMALLEDKSNYRFDMSRAQAYLDTVSDRTNAYDLLAMLGYIMQGSRAAEGFITVKNTSTVAYTIPQFSVVTNPTKEVLFFTKDAVEVSGEESKSIPVQAGTIFQVVKQGIAEFTLKDIDEKGRLFLGKTSLAQNGIYVRSSTASTKWVYLDYVLLQDSSTYYTVGTSETGEMYVQFPDNYMSLIGNDKLTVYATYTNGANSNIAKNVLSTFSDNQKDAGGKVQLSSVFTVSQTEDIYSGQDEETIDHAIQTYYETKDVCSTLVTAQDFTTALRYLLLSNTRVFSNVIVETPQTKTKRMMTTQQGVSYIQLVQPENLDFNKIDVLPTKFSAEYYPSFKPYLAYSGSYESEKAKLETQIDQKLIDQKALPIQINIAGFDKVINQEDGSSSWVVDKFIQPIFATFSPLIYVYLRDNSISQQVLAREAIKRYFHTTYNMKNLAPGSQLSENKIAEDIKKLSTNILAVTVVPLDYTMAQFKSEYLANPTAQFSANSSLSKLSDDDQVDLRRSILGDAVLAGDVPLFKFTNRQNSYSKTNSLYSPLTKEEQVLPIPWGASEYSKEVSFDNGCYLFATKILGDGYNLSSHTLTADEMIQIRRPVFVQIEGHGWSQGMEWTYSLISYTAASPKAEHTNKLFTFYIDLKGEEGIVLPVGTKFTPAVSFSFEGNLASYFSPDVPTEPAPNVPAYDEAKSTFTQGLEYEVFKLSPQNSPLKLTGGYLPLSDFQWTDAVTPTYYLLQPGTKIESGSTYVMQEGERLTIQKASDSEIVDTYGAGDSILLNNLTITRDPSATGIINNGTTSISLMAPKSSTISNENVYFLCLNSNDQTKTIKQDTPYTLEEGEYFIYADTGVTEYVTLGPGTELVVPTKSTTDSISLKVHNNYDIASILPSDFEPLPTSTSLEANFYEITTFVEGDSVTLGGGFKFNNIFRSTGGHFVPSWWRPTENAVVPITITTQDNTTSYNISSSDYSIRHLAILKTAAEGYALTNSTTFALNHTPNLPELPKKPPIEFSPKTTELLQPRLYSSIAVSGFAGSLLTNSPLTCVVAKVGLVKKSQGVYEEQLTTTTGAIVQGFRQNDDSLIPSPYDLKISFSGKLSREKIIASFNIPDAEGPTLFRFRYIQGIESDKVTYTIIYYPSSAGATGTPLTTIDSSSEGGSAEGKVLIYTDNVFVVPGETAKPEGATNLRRIEIKLFSTESYDLNSDYPLKVAIEDISIVDKNTPFDPQLGLPSPNGLPKQLGGSDESSDAYNLLVYLAKASAAAKNQRKMPFNWLYYSLDRVSSPLDPRSFFLPAHPKYSKVFPLYIEDASKIKFPQRG